MLETAHDLKSAIQRGDWASVALVSVGTALDAMAMDPFGAILAAGWWAGSPGRRTSTPVTATEYV
ncbi:MAG: hypothetical protein QOH91_270, partial [Mycobacterium sp.]|nr:hypothetical protein [Mycobacterium sp.]